MNFQEAMESYERDRAQFEALGVILQPSVRAYTTPELKRNHLALDAQPELSTLPNTGVPFWLSTTIDPAVYEILFAPLKAAEIMGEQKRGTWVDTTIMFPISEITVEVNSYGDFNENGLVGANYNWPSRQSYLFQTILEYGDREVEAVGLGRVNYVSDLEKAAAFGLAQFTNLSYFLGIAGLENYGIFNYPDAGASLTPGPKANGGVTWFTNTGAPNATANEVYDDIVALYTQVIRQNFGLVDKESRMILAMSPGSEVALTFTNSYGVNVQDLLKKNFPNMRIITAPQYEGVSAANPQGYAGGNFIQLIVDSIQGQKTGFSAYNERMRAHTMVRQTSSWKQKKTSGTWGTVIRMPIAIASMVGM